MSYSLAFSQAIFTVIFVADKVRQGIYDFVPTQAFPRRSISHGPLRSSCSAAWPERAL